MKHNFFLALILFGCMLSLPVSAQENQTIFNSAGIKHSSGYGAVSNKFTTINGYFANMPEVYGGWFINRSFMIGLEGAATTNYIPVPLDKQDWNGTKMTYQYGQFGLMMEYVIASDRKVHLNLNLMTGTGFLLQYDRDDFSDWHFEDHDVNTHFFLVLEPGAQLEFNFLKWMRFSPGVSYRRVFNSQASGLSDNDLSGFSGNLTLKFGRF
ncbi:hypothetical protein [Flavihumibacter fluvii]|uniref:hypothetical protein n=1 Tax=Flavihumibacter fluvii TaxID=2838157 RepID=UPI001BDE35B6|nr:hypothetical protein [Flavihumibacter fluvii]ULQ53446.1 hypothetical protein KJS93_03820 [Flavihumibacter fluvii]